MDEERKIEKLLRTYAKKRRAEAKEPLKLDSIARRRLQDEVRKRQAKPESDDSLSLWQLLRQQWVFLTGFALLCCFAGVMFLPALSASKNEAKNIQSVERLKEIGVVLQSSAVDANGNLPISLDALANQFSSTNVLTDPQSGKRFIYAGAGQNIDRLQTNAVLVYSPADEPRRAVLLADGTIELADQAEFKKLTDNSLGMNLTLAKSERMIAAPNMAGAPAPEAAFPQPEQYNGNQKIQVQGGRSDNIQNGVNNGLSGQQNQNLANGASVQNLGGAANQAASAAANSAANATYLFQKHLASAKEPPVLSDFEIAQNGNAIQITDRDGSVYDGVLLSSNVSPAAGVPIAKDAIAPIGNMTKALPGVLYQFRVAGTNLTLKQKVVFTGSLMPMSTNRTAVTLNTFNAQGNGFGGNLAEKIPSIDWGNVDIIGTAWVAETNRIEIDAVSP